MEKENKRKIFYILKKIEIGLIILIGLIVLTNSCVKKTKALENIENYNIYTNVGQISNINNTGTIYTIQFTNDRIYYYYNGNFEYQEQYTHFTIYFNSNDLENEINETLKIDITELKTGTIVFFGGFVDNETDTYYIDRITTITRYLDALTSRTYNIGYISGTDTSNPNSSYNKGIADGKSQQQEIDNQTLQETIASYENQIETLTKSLNNEINNNGANNWISFKNLLGLIFMYPIRFIKEGMDVNIWGVNIGGLILGLLMIGITITLISIFKGKEN